MKGLQAAVERRDLRIVALLSVAMRERVDEDWLMDLAIWVIQYAGEDAVAILHILLRKKRLSVERKHQLHNAIDDLEEEARIQNDSKNLELAAELRGFDWIMLLYWPCLS